MLENLIINWQFFNTHTHFINYHYNQSINKIRSVWFLTFQNFSFLCQHLRQKLGEIWVRYFRIRAQNREFYRHTP